MLSGKRWPFCLGLNVLSDPMMAWAICEFKVSPILIILENTDEL